ncbi:hypothetical protein GCM10008931_44460 [Oceanobacillus oncorhynchi subsp. oncorhynchi]|uniref:hypothetical protein n=1 Tax=Oceanobacillus oncorhynchi TaxID=545501 RepID=UPI0031DF2F2C
MIQIIPTQLLCIRKGLDDNDVPIYNRGEVYDIFDWNPWNKKQKDINAKLPSEDGDYMYSLKIPVGHPDFLVVYERKGDKQND